jgi:hypothetical protein
MKTDRDSSLYDSYLLKDASDDVKNTIYKLNGEWQNSHSYASVGWDKAKKLMNTCRSI